MHKITITDVWMSKVSLNGLLRKIYFRNGVARTRKLGRAPSTPFVVHNPSLIYPLSEILNVQSKLRVLVQRILKCVHIGEGV